MKNKIFFSEWTETELIGRERCSCDCHIYPGVYPTTEDNPCHHCHHINQYGYFPGFLAQGWVEYWRSDRVNSYAAR